MKNKFRNLIWILTGVILMGVLVFATTTINDDVISTTNVTATNLIGDGSGITGLSNHYNHTLDVFNLWNTTWDDGISTEFNYNHTSDTFTLYNDTWDNLGECVTYTGSTKDVALGDNNLSLNRISLSVGTEDLPSLSFYNDPGTGLYSPNPTEICITGDTSSLMCFDDNEPFAHVLGKLEVDGNSNLYTITGTRGYTEIKDDTFIQGDLNVSGNITLNKHICLDGTACTKYIHYNGSDTIIQG